MTTEEETIVVTLHQRGATNTDALIYLTPLPPLPGSAELVAGLKGGVRVGVMSTYLFRLY